MTVDGVASSSLAPRAPSHEADHPDPLPQRRGPAPGHARRPAPRRSPGFDEVEWLVIDDGSTDRTVEVARAYGVDHIVKLTNNKGLASAFQAGLDAALKLGADVIVNTDADNQYCGGRHPRRWSRRSSPARPTWWSATATSWRSSTSRATKKRLQRLGSWVVRQASDTDVPDATSGFRAYNREAALGAHRGVDVHLHARVAHPGGQEPGGGRPRRRRHERQDPRVAAVRVDVVLRPPQHAGDLPHLHRLRAAAGVLDAGRGAAASASLAAWAPFLWDWIVHGDRGGHLQSIILGGVLLMAAVQIFALGVLADLIASHRVVTQRTLERVRRIELELGVAAVALRARSQPGRLERSLRSRGRRPGLRQVVGRAGAGPGAPRFLTRRPIVSP